MVVASRLQISYHIEDVRNTINKHQQKLFWLQCTGFNRIKFLTPKKNLIKYHTSKETKCKIMQ